MALLKTRWTRAALRVHRFLTVLGGVALILWGGSGLLHIAMTNFGPQSAQFRPPQEAVDLAAAHPIAGTLRAAGIEKAAAIRVIASEPGSLLQVTETQEDPRRYFDLETGSELPGHDRRHAEYLARYYLGMGPSDSIRSTEVIHSFSDTYPWVNRLLPVYRVEFERPDQLAAYVYTETNALAAVTNRPKQFVQTAFSWFHTWSWFPRMAEWLRVLMIGGLIGSLLCLSLSGSVLLIQLRGRRSKSRFRRLHRIGAWVLTLPIFMLTSSALYHLLSFAGHTPGRALELATPFAVESASFPIHEEWREMSTGLEISTVSIVKGAHDKVLYRLGLASQGRGKGAMTSREIRNARFDGIPITGPAVYIDAETGEAIPKGDRQMAIELGTRWLGREAAELQEIQPIHRFGSGYDFRNKRLPVWRLDYGEPVNASIFVDTTTGVLADRLLDEDKLERTIFSYLHKWNFLFPLGRRVQSLIVALAVGGGMILLAGLGFAIRRSKG